jgi:site-specific DNA-methyltransferase (adenine-specific)
MLAEAAAAGRFAAPGFEGVVPKIQIVTIETAMRLRDRAVQVPLRRSDTFRRAAVEVDRGAQGALDL